METYLSLHPITFPTPLNSKIKTEEFLTACSDFVKFLDLFGKTFTPAIYDMSGNITKITKTYEENCDKNLYLEDMLLAEKSEGEQTATDALMWLRRGLNFMIVFFDLLCIDESKQEDLSVFVREAYSNTLKMYHGWITRNLFHLLAGMTPKRTLFLKSIALNKDDCEEYALKDIQAFIPNLKLCVQHLISFYINHGLESQKKV